MNRRKGLGERALGLLLIGAALSLSHQQTLLEPARVIAASPGQTQAVPMSEQDPVMMGAEGQHIKDSPARRIDKGRHFGLAILLARCGPKGKAYELLARALADRPGTLRVSVPGGGRLGRMRAWKPGDYHFEGLVERCPESIRVDSSHGSWEASLVAIQP